MSEVLREKNRTGSTAHRTRCIRLMLVGSFIGLFTPILGFLIGTIVRADVTVGGLEPLLFWMLIGMFVGMAGTGVAILGALQWVSGKRCA
ncbi:MULTISPECIES: hypothetical protein [Cryobacterium]|uniref:Uncharacterized protein n=1 Tax=Cryobacterium serini TaxID=1259201 RepID=A0A4R9BLE2_9MICO|nr:MULTISPECIES: hypothetical protein [Cryobacterium]TFD86927.1 hypothetical protein E3T51_10850 [Cryobacterium serini]